MSSALEIGQGEDAVGVPAAAELSLLLGRVGWKRLEEMGWIRVTGSDRVRWLNGMVTNSIQELGPGDGNYSFVLNAQGRIQGDLWAFAEDEELLLETGRDRVVGLMALLDRYIIMDEVELEDVSDSRAGFVLAGPGSAALLAAVGLPGDRQRMRQVVRWQGRPVEVIAGYGPLVPRFELWTAVENADVLESALEEAGERLGGGRVGDRAMEQLRVLEGTPRFGVDIREKELPQETGQTRALHFAKGCYLGQEIVERIRSRGNVHRQFGAFRLEGPSAEAGTVLEAAGKAIGELTTVARISLPGQDATQYGLGYARRDAVGLGEPLEYRIGGAVGVAVPVTLPIGRDAVAEGHSGITQDGQED